MQWELHFGDANRTYIKLLRNASRKIWKHLFSSTLHGNYKGQTILLLVHREKPSRYLRYTIHMASIRTNFTGPRSACHSAKSLFFDVNEHNSLGSPGKTNYNLVTHRPPPTIVNFQNVANNVNFETQDCEHFPGEAGISQHFLRKCIQLMAQNDDIW